MKTLLLVIFLCSAAFHLWLVAGKFALLPLGKRIGGIREFQKAYQTAGGGLRALFWLSTSMVLWSAALLQLTL